MPRNEDSLELSLAPTVFERRNWTVQRVGWLVMVALLAAALAGGFGDRPVGAVVRPAIVYFALLVIFRLTGKRSVGEISTFDFLLLLIISESVSASLLAGDNSVGGALLAAITLVVLDLGLSLAKRGVPALDRLLEDEPAVLFLDGKLQDERMRKERVSVGDILEAAREHHGLTSLEEIRCAVLERRGKISVIPVHPAG